MVKVTGVQKKTHDKKLSEHWISQKFILVISGYVFVTLACVIEMVGGNFPLDWMFFDKISHL